MYRNNQIGVAVPAYNEEGLVADVLESIPSYVDRVYVVDDASTDGTWDEITGAVVRRDGHDSSGATTIQDGGIVADRVVPIRHAENRGVGGAIKTGYLRALEDDVDVVAVIAGDGQMDPEYLDALLDPIVDDRADYAKGNRFVRPDTRANVPTFRFRGNVVLSWLTRVASGYWAIGDSQNGYSAISREALEDVPIEDMYEFYGYCNDLLVKLNVEEKRVIDVPIPIRYGEETSTIDYRTYVPLVSAMLLSNFLWRLKERYLIRDFHPLVLLYGLGVLGVASVLVGLATAARSLDSDGHANVVNRGLLSLLCLVLAMVFDRQENDHLSERLRE